MRERVASGTTRRTGVADLERKARILRCHIIRMLCTAGSGHPGGALSSADIVAALFFRHLKHHPSEPDWPDRDRFILSKGHSAPLLYAALAECGYFPVAELKTLRKINSRLQGHPHMRKTPGVEASTGSLGQGLSIGCGMALGARLNKRKYRVHVLLGDGELQEGQIWEAAMFASHYRLSNLVAIVDLNRLQVDGPTNRVMSLDPLPDKWKAFGWRCIIINGHDMRQILSTLAEAEQEHKRPVVILAETVKGKGVSFMENQVDWHGRVPNAEETARALDELSGTRS